MSCLRCGATLGVQRVAKASLVDRLARRHAEPIVRCGNCGWRPGEPYPPDRAEVASGEFVCGSTATSEVGSLSFDDLPARDATALATIVARDLPGAVRRLPPDIAAITAPKDRLEQSVAWLLEADPAGATATSEDRWRLDLSSMWARAAASEVPWWAWFRDGAALFVPLGLDVARRVDAVHAVIVTTILQVREGAEFRRSNDRSTSVLFRKPVVAIGTGELDVVGSLQVLAHRAFRKGEWTTPSEVVSRYSSWLGDAPMAPRVEPAELPAIAVERTGLSTWVVTMTDDIAQEHEGDVERFVDALATQDLVTSVTHEDRELLVVELNDDRAGWLASFTESWWRDVARVPVVVEA